jgi:beta-glucosidase-like glycosyl hydrolase
MNAKRKELMEKRIAAAIKRILKVCKKAAISMKWKEDPSKENQGLGEAKNGVGEGTDPIENQNGSVSVENNNSRREEDEAAKKASRRCQKIPVTDEKTCFFLDNHQQKTVKVEKKGKMKQKPKPDMVSILHHNVHKKQK